jgi:hypothetical protein
MRHGASRFVCADARPHALASHPRRWSIPLSHDHTMRIAARDGAARTAGGCRGRRGRRWRVAPSISRVEKRWSCRRSLLSPYRADACMPPLVAMPITQSPDPAPARACKRCARTGCSQTQTIASVATGVCHRDHRASRSSAGASRHRCRTLRTNRRGLSV